MKYPNIKAAKLSHADIARLFGFKSVKSFNRTSAHHRYMNGLEGALAKVKAERLFYDLEQFASLTPFEIKEAFKPKSND